MPHPLMGGRKSLALLGVKKRRPATASGSSASLKKPVSKMEQLYLDFGQKSFGRQIHCQRCGMMYTEGEPNDEAAHRAHHERAVRGAVMRECDSERVVSRDKDGIRIVTVRASSAEQQQKRVREAMDLMAVDLGDLALPQDFCAFLAIGPDARLHGCAIAHPIHVAYHAEFAAACQTDESGCSTDRIRPASAKSNTHAKQSASLRRGEKASPAACGISHIWVASQYRRRGVGMLLLEAVRRHMASSFELERRQMAFCQPTDAGCALALAYIGEGLPLLVYDGSEFTMDNREASSQPTDGNSVR